MPQVIYALEKAPDDPLIVGGKAASLGRLLRSGLPVPPGFVLSVDAFRAYLIQNKTEDAIPSFLTKDAGAAEAGLLARMRAGRWPGELRSVVEEAYGALAKGGRASVAVRSSAAAEDSAGASFAGQHATVLNVEGAAAVLDAMLVCWASLYSATAVQYRQTRGLGDSGPAMAVVVQALVPAEAAGVAFTLDPVGGSTDVVVINAAWGLGEGVVSGLVTPDDYEVRKADGALIRKVLAHQKVQVVAAPEGGTRTEDVPAAKAAGQVLSDERAAELARLCVRIEEEAGAPQDVEWSLAGGRLFILQARPITAAAPPASAVEDGRDGWVSEFDTDTDPETIWTSANVQEVLPDQLSPLGCSITQAMLERFGTEPLERTGIRLENKDPFSAYFYGRAFLNVSMMIEVAEQSPFGSVDALMDQFLGIARDPNAKPQRPSPRKLLRYAVILPRAAWQSLRMPADIRRAERIVAGFMRLERERPVAKLSEEALVREMEESIEPITEVSITHVTGAGITSATFELLRRLAERWLGDENGMLQAKLVTGLGGLESAQPAYELWDLSRFILTSDRLREAFEPRDGAEIERRVSAPDGEEAAAFRRRLDGFLERHGHRSVMEAEFSARSWEEDLPTVFTMLRNYLHARESSDPRTIEERQRKEREAATEEALRRLRWWQQRVFKYVLGEAQRWVISREHTKSLLVRGSQRGRQYTRELGRRLVAKGLLDSLWDLYYLTWDEVKNLVRGAIPKEDAYVGIRRRKAEEERNRTVVLPETFTGRPKPLRPAEMPLPEGDTLHGIPVSPGRVTGPARVILDPRVDATIEPGEILVAPVTDAGWTPLFVAAAGIVVDIGGTLSHGSTVAREYGLPAVVNVKHGTRLIRTGQTITVDGERGVVVLEGGG